MAVQIYKNGKWRTLAGKKIAKNGEWYTPKATDKLYLNNKWYNIGFETVGASSTTDPSLAEVTFHATDEPTTGTAYYMTPEGAGNMDGTSWDNAYSGAMIHIAMLSMASGDRLYMTEGNYTNDRVITLPAGVSIFGGFTATNPTWATRDSFAHQTVWTQQASTYGWITMNADSTTGQCIDGVTIAPAVACEYKKLTFRNITLTGGFLADTQDKTYCGIEYSRIINVFYNNDDADIDIEFSLINIPAANCIAVNCSVNANKYTVTKLAIFGKTAINCIAVNCSVNAISDRYVESAAIFCGYLGSNIQKIIVINCIAVNCSVNAKGASKEIQNLDVSTQAYIFGHSDFNTYFYGYKSCTAVNCNVTANAWRAHSYIFYYKNYNCLSWNNSGTEYRDYSYATTSAGSTYNAALALTLGTDNSIAKFTDTGYYPAQGVQDTGNCPSPIDDPDGYAAYIASFGDWHPLASSFLVGKGTAQSDVTTDADGVTRPSPPTIGAYEPVPTT